MNSKGESLKIGSREWWLNQIGSRNSGSLKPVLQIVEDKSSEQSSTPYLHIARLGSGSLPKDWSIFDEAMLRQAFRGIGLFNAELDLMEESVKLGKHQKKIDLVSSGFDGSHWAIEFKIVEEEREIGDRKVPINVERMGASIGQSLLYSLLYKTRYPSSSASTHVMPVVCTWSLGSGSSQVIELCKRVGVTVINLDRPAYMPYGQALTIYYLGEDSPRLFSQAI